MRWLYFLQSIRRNGLDRVMLFFTHLGDKGVFWVLSAGLLCLFARTRAAGLSMFVAMGFSVLIGNVLIKNLVGRARPCWIDREVDLLIAEPSDYSFPSGHTYASFSAAFSILPFLHPITVAVAILIAGLIGFSRMYLFVHFFTDVLVSIFLGIFTGLAAASMFL